MINFYSFKSLGDYWSTVTITPKYSTSKVLVNFNGIGITGGNAR